MLVRSSSEEGSSTSTAETPAVAEQPANHTVASNGTGADADAPVALDFSALPEAELEWQEPSGGQKMATSFKLAFALPWCARPGADALRHRQQRSVPLCLRLPCC